jgi:hypothetical protein
MWGSSLSDLIRLRYNTQADQTPGGEWKWRVILETQPEQYQEVLVKELVVNVPSFSKTDEMPVVGRKYHLACYGELSVDADGIGTINPAK